MWKPADLMSRSGNKGDGEEIKRRLRGGQKERTPRKTKKPPNLRFDGLFFFCRGSVITRL